ncbi:MAG: RNA polymerase sigma factor [Flavobacteriales bacterium]|nr:RNA polymerase sigma factor [Flavobacteriales bacterium]
MTALQFQNQLVVNHPLLSKFAYQFTRNLEDARDLVQDTMLKALKYRDQFEDGTNLRGWLFTIMRNTFINQCNQRKHRQQMTNTSVKNAGLEWERQPQPDPVSQMTAADIELLVEGLPKDCSKVFRMFLEGYHYEEIASTVGVPVGTVKSRIFYARKALMNQLQDLN